MDIEKLKTLIKLAKDEGLKKIKYADASFSATVDFSSSPEYSNERVNYGSLQKSSSSEEQKSSKPVADKKSSYHQVKSPFVGTFYSSPTPNDPVFVKVGDKVSKGQVLCILEAMKIMNEIESDVSGEIISINVENESLVEFGQVLFEIKV